MTDNVAPANIAFDPTGRIARDIPCIHCGYNLRTLLPEQACPECNTPIARSLRDDRLRFCDPRWLRRQARGMAWILVGTISLLVWPFGVIDSPWGAMGWLESLVAWLGIPQGARDFVIALLVFGIQPIGIWLATWLEPGVARTYRDPKLRPAARGFAAGFLLLMLAFSLDHSAAPLRRMWLVRSLAAVLLAAGWLCFYLYISGLGRRAGAHRRARFAQWAGIALALIGLVSAGISAWLAVYVREWLAGSLDAAIRMLVPVMQISFVLLGVLSLLLAILYGWLFRREAQLAKQQMPGPITATKPAP